MSLCEKAVSDCLMSVRLWDERVMNRSAAMYRLVINVIHLIVSPPSFWFVCVTDVWRRTSVYYEMLLTNCCTGHYGLFLDVGRSSGHIVGVFPPAGFGCQSSKLSVGGRVSQWDQGHHNFPLRQNVSQRRTTSTVQNTKTFSSPSCTTKRSIK